MPEAAINEDDHASASEDQVAQAAELLNCSAVKSIAEAVPGENAPGR